MRAACSRRSKTTLIFACAVKRKHNKDVLFVSMLTKFGTADRHLKLSAEFYFAPYWSIS